MSNPYPVDLSPVHLTIEDTDFLRQRLERDEATLMNVRADRAVIQAKLDSRDRVIATLERSVEEAKLALGDLAGADHPLTTQGDRLVHTAQWGNADPDPTRVFQPAEPSGRCKGCQEPLWPTANGSGLVHAYGGADCFPEQEDTPQAELAEPVR